MEINALDIDLLVKIIKEATKVSASDKSRLIKSLQKTMVDNSASTQEKKQKPRRNENTTAKEEKTRGKTTRVNNRNIRSINKRRARKVAVAPIVKVKTEKSSEKVEVIDNGKKLAFGEVFGTNKEHKDVLGPFDGIFHNQGPRNAANRLARAYPEFVSQWNDFVEAMKDAGIPFSVSQQEMFIIDNYTHKHALTYEADWYEVSDVAYENLLDTMQSRLNDLIN